MGALEFDFWAWRGESDRRGHPAFAFLRPCLRPSFLSSLQPTHATTFPPLDTFFISHLLQRRVNAHRQFHPGTGEKGEEEKSRTRVLDENGRFLKSLS